MKKNSITVLFVFFLAFVSSLIGYFHFFYIGKEERAFLIKTQETLKTSDGSINIRDITDFDWDKVCYWQSDELNSFVSPEITKDPKEKNKIRKYYKSLIFLKQGNITKVLGYKRLKNIEIEDENFSFLKRFKGRICGLPETAQLAKESLETKCCGISRSITFISLETEN